MAVIILGQLVDRQIQETTPTKQVIEENQVLHTPSQEVWLRVKLSSYTGTCPKGEEITLPNIYKTATYLFSLVTKYSL